MRALALATGLALAAPLPAAPPAGTLQVQPTAVQWRAAGPAMPPGTQIAVLEGDPRQPGLFTIRLKVPAGTKLAPHWHPRDERVTVLAGSVAVGFGDVADEAAVTRFAPGSFYVNPARSHHYVQFAEETVVQITGEGPWQVHFIEARVAPAPR